MTFACLSMSLVMKMGSQMWTGRLENRGRKIMGSDLGGKGCVQKTYAKDIVSLSCRVNGGNLL